MCAFVVFKHKEAHYKCLYNNNNNLEPEHGIENSREVVPEQDQSSRCMT